MGTPIKCPNCTSPNGILRPECVKCGVPLDGADRPEVEDGAAFELAPSATWETDNLHDLWRAADRGVRKPTVEIDCHVFLRYCLLLRAMQEALDEEDAHLFFDDALFFARGGFDFFCHLNTSSALKLRARIFGGLKHGRRPALALRAWFERIVRRAVQLGHPGVDVFVADEITSGTG